jgi:hypothetical protein
MGSSVSDGSSPKPAKTDTQPMGHSVHPIASTSAAACSAAMFAAANRAVVVCSVERRGGFRSTCPIRCFMIFICSSQQQQQQQEDELHYLVTQTAAEARERRN